MKRFLSILLWLLTAASAVAQITGQVVDADDGMGVPYASVLYKGNHTSVASNGEGKFTIARHNGWRLTVSSVGYVTQVININSTTPNHLIIRLKADTKKLQEVTVNSKRKTRYSRKNNPAVELMRKVIANKKRYNLKNHDYYQYNNYQKITTGLNDLTPKNLEEGFFKKHPWLLNQVEMCQYNDKLVLPLSVDETVTQKIYRKEPHKERVIVKGEQSTGVNDLFQTGDIVDMVVKDIFTDIDIFEDDIRLFRNHFTSPIGRNAIAFYRYYITDTVYVGNERCVHLDFTPNNQLDMGFRGQIYIVDDSTYQVKRCELTIPHDSEVNWIHNMQCMQEYTRLPTGEWVLNTDDMLVELEVASFITQAFVIRTTRRSDFSFDEPSPQLLRGNKVKLRDPKSQMQDDEFWNQYRQVELTKSEGSMDSFVKHIEELKGIKYVLFVMRLLMENFIETGDEDHPSKVDIGPVNTIISQNFYDKVRVRASAQTTANLHPHLYLKGYVAHGFEHNQNYYGGDFTYTFNKPAYLPREFPRQALTFSSMRDVAMPSDKFIDTDKDNVFSSVKSSSVNKMFLYNRQEVKIDWERDWGLTTYASAKTERVAPIGDIALERLSDHCQLPRIRYTEATVGVRYSPGEEFINSKQHRWPVNYDSPVFRLQHTMGFDGLLGGQYRYNFTEGEIYHRLWMPMSWGKMNLRLKFGAQWDRVPYPLLIMPAANLSYIMNNETFNLINNMAFLNDRYASWEMRWDLNGKLFNRIPLFKRLKWREFLCVKGLWGRLTDKNNPYLPENQMSDVLMTFPEGCYIMDGSRPYWELSAGIHNIFKLFHVEYIRRMNYLDLPTSKKWGVRFAIHASF